MVTICIAINNSYRISEDMSRLRIVEIDIRCRSKRDRDDVFCAFGRITGIDVKTTLQEIVTISTENIYDRNRLSKNIVVVVEYSIYIVPDKWSFVQCYGLFGHQAQGVQPVLSSYCNSPRS